jgi:hypothetical protein
MRKKKFLNRLCFKNGKEQTHFLGANIAKVFQIMV